MHKMVCVSDLLPSTCSNQIEILFYDFGFWHGEPNTQTLTFTLIMTIEHTEFIHFQGGWESNHIEMKNSQRLLNWCSVFTFFLLVIRCAEKKRKASPMSLNGSVYGFALPNCVWIAWKKTGAKIQNPNTQNKHTMDWATKQWKWLALRWKNETNEI